MLLSQLLSPIPSHTQSLLFHLLRNMSQSSLVAQQIYKFPGFLQTAFQALQTGALRVQEFIISIFGNLIKHNITQAGPLETATEIRQNVEIINKVLPKEPIQGICPENFTVTICLRLLHERSRQAQVMALRLLDMYVLNGCQNVIRNPDILTHILPLLKE